MYVEPNCACLNYQASVNITLALCILIRSLGITASILQNTKIWFARALYYYPACESQIIALDSQYNSHCMLLAICNAMLIAIIQWDFYVHTCENLQDFDSGCKKQDLYPANFRKCECPYIFSKTCKKQIKKRPIHNEQKLCVIHPPLHKLGPGFEPFTFP